MSKRELYIKIDTRCSQGGTLRGFINPKNGFGAIVCEQCNNRTVITGAPRGLEETSLNAAMRFTLESCPDKIGTRR